MEFNVFTAGPDDNDRRLDRIIRKFVSSENLAGIYKAIRKGLVKINDKKCQVSDHVFAGDSIKIASFLLPAEKPKENQEKLNKKNEIIPVFKNKHLLIINKKYNTLVHGSADSLDKIIEGIFLESEQAKESLSFKPGPLHRLDRMTTGLLAFSQSITGARWFSDNISTHTIKKTYFAVIQGKLMQKQVWENFIDTEKDQNLHFKTVKITDDENNGKKALSVAEPVSYGIYKGRDITLAKISIETGRTHQIRSQAAQNGFPLLGDTAYGGEKTDEKQMFFLHAYELTFPKDNPLDLPEKITADFPSSLNDFLEKHIF